MSKIVRTLTMAGLGLLAGASLGAPALAADNTTRSGGKTGGAQVQQHGGREYVAGFYRTLGACKKAGAVGDWFGKWDNPRCYPVRVGFRRGTWLLKVEQERRHGHWGHRDRGHGHIGHFRGHDRRDFRGVGTRGNDFRGHDFRGNDRGHGFGNRGN